MAVKTSSSVKPNAVPYLPEVMVTNTSSNSLVGKLIREGSPEIKMMMEDLLHGKVFHTVIDEQIVFQQLDHNDNAVWSLLLASGDLRGDSDGLFPVSKQLNVASATLFIYVFIAFLLSCSSALIKIL